MQDAIRVEVDHVTDRPVDDGRREDGNVILVAPVVDAFGVVDFFPEAMDHFGGRPIDALLLLLLHHLVQNRRHEVLKLAVVVVRHQQVANAIDPLPSQPLPLQLEASDVRGSDAFDEILLDPTRGGDQDIHKLVLHQKSDDLSHAARDHVGGVAKEDFALEIGTVRRVKHPLIVLSLGDGVVRKAPVEL